ncbi:MAG: metal ABC transporter permease [Oscillospiraceae bacterium]|nr:metal ABC transporter permease [Oscillospiraceae bacterium]
MSIIYNFFSSFLPFAWADYKFMVNALIAVLLIAPLMGILGTMAVNNKMAFFSDALGHSAFTGIALGVLLGVKNEMISLIAFGVFLALIITRVKNKGKASSDTVISVFSSTAVAVGILILSYGGGFSKYSAYLVGDILSVTKGEILCLALTLVAVLIVWAFIYNKLLIISINKELAASRGIKTVLYENIFVTVVAIVVMMSIKWVGILLINSLLILPAAAARNIAKNSRQYLGFSVLISTVCAVSGLLISFYSDTSAGATIVTVSAIVFFATYIFRKK